MAYSLPKIRKAPFKIDGPLHFAFSGGRTSAFMLKAFQKAQDFNLMLPDNEGKTPLGNCDGCMMKSEKSRAALVRDYPDHAAMVAAYGEINFHLKRQACDFR